MSKITAGRIAPLLALFCMCTLSARAQEDTAKWSFELLAGPSFSTFYSSNAPQKIFSSEGILPRSVPADYRVEDDPAYYPYERNIVSRKRTGVAFGVLAVRSLNKRYSLVAGLAYEQKGIRHSETITEWDGLSFRSDTFSFTNQELSSKVSNNYITLPVMVRRVYSNGFSLDAGVYVGYLVSSKLRQTIKKEHFEQRGQYMSMWGSTMNFGFGEKPNTAKVDAGLTVAAGYRYRLDKKTALLIRMAGSMGLLKLDNQFNNDFRKDIFISGYILHHGNYHGYNSQSKNIQVQATVGVSRSF